MEKLYEHNARIVYRFLYSICHDKQLAEDLTQETFLQAYKSIERFDGSCKISSWLCQIARHLLYRHYEKNRREIPTAWEGTEEFVPKIPAPDGRVMAKLELMEVLRDMQKLPPAMREVIYLRITGELTFSEIGEIMGRSENWARVTFYRGKEILWKERGMKNERKKSGKNISE
ncbi:MAG: sigma-70 family RNA polymerase sigma factor [Lachnospiraceae bacterium]|nr:sigma-70 family RNA polymerase sigma factor [Lachnospiraceae bacterium]